MRASLNPEGVLEGRWETTTERNYYGSFQLVGRRDGSGYVGHWTGVNRENLVRAGSWKWHTAQPSGRPAPAPGAPYNSAGAARRT